MWKLVITPRGLKHQVRDPHSFPGGVRAIGTGEVWVQQPDKGGKPAPRTGQATDNAVRTAARHGDRYRRLN